MVVVMVGRVTSVEVSIAHIVVILAVWVEASCAHHELGVGVALTTAVVADVGSWYRSMRWVARLRMVSWVRMLAHSLSAVDHLALVLSLMPIGA